MPSREVRPSGAGFHDRRIDTSAASRSVCRILPDSRTGAWVAYFPSIARSSRASTAVMSQPFLSGLSARRKVPAFFQTRIWHLKSVASNFLISSENSAKFQCPQLPLRSYKSTALPRKTGTAPSTVAFYRVAVPLLKVSLGAPGGD